MPIYAYKCSACGHAQDVLQKMSDPLLTVCPECEQATYTKQVTAAGFQLKGSGWYVTDFRNNGASASGDKPAASDSTATAAAPSADSGSSATPAAASTAASAPAPAAPASSGTSSS